MLFEGAFQAKLVYRAQHARGNFKGDGTFSAWYINAFVLNIRHKDMLGFIVGMAHPMPMLPGYS